MLRYLKIHTSTNFMKHHPWRNSSSSNNLTFEHPFKRTMRILKNDFKQGFSRKPHDELTDFDSYCDVLIIGGGAIGSSIAYWLKKKAQKGLHVVVVEKDQTYATSSTTLSVGGLRQQFSVEENVQMSLFTADFLRNIKQHLGPLAEVNFNPFGYLFLASDKSADQLIQNSKMQNELGARNIILSMTKIKLMFPWINIEDVSLGCLGLEKEGWFDPWSLLQAFRYRSLQLGAKFVTGEVEGFLQSYNDTLNFPEGGCLRNLGKAIVRQNDGDLKIINFAICVIAAGSDSGKVSRMANVGKGKEILSIPLPVEPRKRYVYSFKCQDNKSPGLNTPLTIDKTGTYFRRYDLNGSFIGGASPETSQEPSCNNLEVDYEYFYNHVWPILAQRVPCFEAIKLYNAWAGYYEVNVFDKNGVIGAHPFYNNLYFATGFSGHGIQQAPAVGRAISELIIDGRYKTIDLTRLSFNRLILNQPLMEKNIV